MVRFEELDHEDVATVLREICEVSMEDSAIEYVAGGGKCTVAMLYRWAQRIERIAKTKSLETVTATDLGG